MARVNIRRRDRVKVDRLYVDTLAVKGDTYYVDSVAGDASNSGLDPEDALATVNQALAKCTANQGDTVVVLPGYTETVSAADAWSSIVAGVTIIGLGFGASRPTITFGTVNGASIAIDVASVAIKNIVGVGNKDGLTNPFHVTGNDCTLDIEWRDTSATVEAVAVVKADTVSRLKVALKYRGFTTGDAAARPIHLIAVTGADIWLDAYGVVSTSWVDMTGTLSTNVSVRGRTFTQGVTDGSRNVVDTIGSSKWDMVVFDASAGAVYSGGSAAAVASDDISAVFTRLGAPAGASVSADIAAVLIQLIRGTGTALPNNQSLYDVLAGANGVATWAAAAAPGDGVSLAEALRDLWDAVRNGTGGSEPGTNKSLVDAIGFDGVAAVAATAGMLRVANGSRFVVKKTLTSSAIVQAGVDVTAVSTVGDILIEDFVLQTDGTGLAVGTNFTMETNNAKGTAVFCSHAVASLGAQAVVDKKNATTGKGVVLESGKKVIAKSTVADCTGAGTMDVYLFCRRLVDNATLVAA